MENIIGYYVDFGGDRENAGDVFVALGDSGLPDHKFAYYCPIGQHGEGLTDYLDECTPITKEEYVAATKSYYTPKEYIK